MKKLSISQNVFVLLLLMLCSVAKAQKAGDKLTTVADKGKSGMYVATLSPDHDVAIDKNVAELYTIYTDNGIPNLLRMRQRNGKFTIKAGDHAVIKTIDEANITLEETSKGSSAFMDDIICPTADMTAEDFFKSHPLGEDEYLYMLTNLERNGGFGFTLFTGSTMRKGCFFIISEVEPLAVSGVRAAKTRADKDLEDGDRVPFLPGEAGSNDGFVTVAQAPEATFLLGDANDDGVVDGKDVTVISDYIIGKPTLTFITEAADVNADGTINVADVVGTLRIIMGEKE